MDYRQVFLNNRKWVAEKKSENPLYFKDLALGQNPEYMVISCCDSRAPIELITGAEPGDMFVHRNIANLVSEADNNLMAVLEYALNVFKVKYIIVCGHTDCAGIRTVYDTDHAGSLEEWLKTARVVKESDPGASYNELIELNIKEQCRNLSRISIIEESIKERGFPLIHGWLYKIESGELVEV
ncbi:MAG: carbonic anhydrase [Marinilabiliaceae bacterium]|jgi:carbonic anhydrase|nr:carbonic anhydrase [Marinilabiliaceae bacterium]